MGHQFLKLAEQVKLNMSNEFNSVVDNFTGFIRGLDAFLPSQSSEAGNPDIASSFLPQTILQISQLAQEKITPAVAKCFSVLPIELLSQYGFDASGKPKSGTTNGNTSTGGKYTVTVIPSAANENLASTSRKDNSNSKRVFKAERIVKERTKNGDMEYYIKWNGYPASANTWEPANHLMDPKLLEDWELAKEKRKEKAKKKAAPKKPKKPKRVAKKTSYFPRRSTRRRRSSSESTLSATSNEYADWEMNEHKEEINQTAVVIPSPLQENVAVTEANASLTTAIEKVSAQAEQKQLPESQLEAEVALGGDELPVANTDASMINLDNAAAASAAGEIPNANFANFTLIKIE